jgi:glycine cleavage system regulatory protein
MDIIESIDAVFQNLSINILNAKGNIELIEKYIKDTKFIIQCYATSSLTNDIDRIIPINITKDCKVV